MALTWEPGYRSSFPYCHLALTSGGSRKSLLHEYSNQRVGANKELSRSILVRSMRSSFHTVTHLALFSSGSLMQDIIDIPPSPPFGSPTPSFWPPCNLPFPSTLLASYPHSPPADLHSIMHSTSSASSIRIWLSFAHHPFEEYVVRS